MERILVIGCAGSGKSTFASRLSAATGLPHIERDALGPEGMPSTLRAIERAAAGSGWIFDGYPYYADHLVLPRADTVVIFDLPRRVVVRQVLMRTARVELTRRPVGAHEPQGLRGLLDREHPVRWAWTSHATRHIEGEALAAEQSGSRKIVIFRKNAAAETFLRSAADER
ncbi:MAG: hypothetical protein ACRD2W_09115 [Acidimicrobiales bacterium]